MVDVKLRTHMSFKQQSFLLKELKKVCKKQGKYSVYLNGHTDEIVSQSVSILWAELNPNDVFNFNKRHVENTRREMIGKHRDVAPKGETLRDSETGNLHVLRGDLKKAFGRIEILEAQIADLVAGAQPLVSLRKHPEGRPPSTPRNGLYDGNS